MRTGPFLPVEANIESFLKDTRNIVGALYKTSCILRRIGGTTHIGLPGIRHVLREIGVDLSGDRDKPEYYRHVAVATAVTGSSHFLHLDRVTSDCSFSGDAGIARCSVCPAACSSGRIRTCSMVPALYKAS